MIDKQEYVTMLVKMGFKAFLSNGIIKITVENKEAFKTAENAIKEIGYKSSWGVSIGEDKCI